MTEKKWYTCGISMQCEYCGIIFKYFNCRNGEFYVEKDELVLLTSQLTPHTKIST